MAVMFFGISAVVLLGNYQIGKKMVISMASDISEINKYREQLEELVR